jgi:hypothetical protein
MLSETDRRKPEGRDFDMGYDAFLGQRRFSFVLSENSCAVAAGLFERDGMPLCKSFSTDSFLQRPIGHGTIHAWQGSPNHTRANGRKARKNIVNLRGVPSVLGEYETIPRAGNFLPDTLRMRCM